MADMENENVIEFIKDEKRATCTFTQGRYISKIRKLAKDFPDECEIVAENEDGSVLAHVPVSWVQITRRKLNLSEEQRKQMAERLRNATSQRKK